MKPSSTLHPPSSIPLTPTHPIHPNLIGRALRLDLVGCGGNGSQMLTGLARMDHALRSLGHPGFSVTVYDGDTVSESNLGRQLFAASDLGQNKAAVLVNRVNAFFGLDWTANTAAWSSSFPDILIGCVDTIAARRKLAKARCAYWLDLGNRDHTGQVVIGTKLVDRRSWLIERKKLIVDRPKPSTILPQLSTNYRPKTFFELFPEQRRVRKEDNTPSCSLAGALERQDLFINQAVTTFGLQLLWQLIRHGHITTNGCFINLQTGNTRPIPLTP